MKNNEIIELYSNTGLKQQFIKNYTKADFSTNSKWTETQAEQQWMEFFKLLSSAFTDNTLSPIHLAPRAEVISALLYVSESGLSMRHGDNHVHFGIEYKDAGRVELQTILGYKGMMRIAMGTGLFKFINTELVFKGDTFSWQGQVTKPVYVSAGPLNNRELEYAFVGFHYKNGDCLYLKIEASELFEIEKASRTHTELTKGTDADSLYLTAWRQRMFEIAAWRIAYNRLREIILFGSERAQAKVDHSGVVKLEPEPAENFMSVFDTPKSA